MIRFIFDTLAELFSILFHDLLKGVGMKQLKEPAFASTIRESFLDGLFAAQGSIF
jgi:hypothetical protein